MLRILCCSLYVIGSYLEQKSKEHNVDKNKLIIGLIGGEIQVQRYDTGANPVWKTLEHIKLCQVGKGNFTLNLSQNRT